MKTKGLTIQEAIQSGLPFKREGWSGYNKQYSKDTPFFIWKHNEVPVPIHLDDILATDWEIKVPEVTITKEKLAEAIKVADRIVPCGVKTVTKSEQVQFIDIVAKELGL